MFETKAIWLDGIATPDDVAAPSFCDGNSILIGAAKALDAEFGPVP